MMKYDNINVLHIFCIITVLFGRTDADVIYTVEYEQIDLTDGPPEGLFQQMSIDSDGKIISILDGTDLAYRDSLVWNSNIDSLTSWISYDNSTINRYLQTSTIYNNSLYVYGGRNSVTDFGNVLKEEESGWRELISDNLTNPHPKSRFGHSSVLVLDGFLIFGGNCMNCSTPFDDTWYFNITENEWETVDTIGSPPPRYGHSSVFLNGYVYIIGGINQNDTLNDIWRLNLGTFQWTQLSDNSEGRAFHSSVLIGNRIVTFGGLLSIQDPKTNLLMQTDSTNTIRIYDIETSKWIQAATNQPSTETPSSRFGHCMLSTDNQILMFGGSSNKSLMNDLWNVKIVFKFNKDDIIMKKVLPGITGALMVVFFVGTILSLSYFFHKQSSY